MPEKPKVKELRVKEKEKAIMLSVHMQVELKASPDEIWRLIGGFNDLPDWLPLIEKSTLDETGKIRHLSLAGGGEIVEQLEEHSDEQRYYRYSIIDSPLPLSNYVATLRVHAQGGEHSIVDWSSHFNADGGSDEEAVAPVQGVYQAGFDQLQKIFSG